jgi:hypothetical protein
MNHSSSPPTEKFHAISRLEGVSIVELQIAAVLETHGVVQRSCFFCGRKPAPEKSAEEQTDLSLHPLTKHRWKPETKRVRKKDDILLLHNKLLPKHTILKQ